MSALRHVRPFICASRRDDARTQRVPGTQSRATRALKPPRGVAKQEQRGSNRGAAGPVAEHVEQASRPGRTNDAGAGRDEAGASIEPSTCTVKGAGRPPRARRSPEWHVAQPHSPQSPHQRAIVSHRVVRWANRVAREARHGGRRSRARGKRVRTVQDARCAACGRCGERPRRGHVVNAAGPERDCVADAVGVDARTGGR